MVDEAIRIFKNTKTVCLKYCDIAIRIFSIMSLIIYDMMIQNSVTNSKENLCFRFNTKIDNENLP